MSGSNHSLPKILATALYPVPPVPRPTRRFWPSLVMGLAGALIGLALSLTPLALVCLYVIAFAVTSTPDSGFNIFLLGALASLAFGGLLFVGAFALLFFRHTRLLGIGYMSGFVVGFACCLIVFVVAGLAV